MKRKSPSDIFVTRRTIDSIKRIASEGANPDSFQLHFKKLFDGVPVTAIPIPNESLYRARWNEKGRLFDHVYELLNPDPKYIKEKGRFNDIGESILYTALCELGSIIELRANINKFFVITKINRLPESELMFFTLGFKDRFLPEGYINQNSIAVRNFLNQEVTKIVNDEAEFNTTIALGRFILSNKISNYIEENLAIAYPSVQSKLTSNVTTYNLAFAPEVFHKHYYVENVVLYVLVHEPSCYKLLDVNSGHIGADGRIHWKFTMTELVDRVKNGMLANDELHVGIKDLEYAL